MTKAPLVEHLEGFLTTLFLTAIQPLLFLLLTPLSTAFNMSEHDVPENEAARGLSRITSRQMETLAIGSPLQKGIEMGTTSALAGLVYSAIVNSMQTHKRGAWGILTRTGGAIGYFAAVGFSYAFTEQLIANQLRTRQNGVSSFGGGCASGFILGMGRGSIPAAFGGCLMLGGAMGTYELAGGNIFGRAYQIPGSDGKGVTNTQRDDMRRSAFYENGQRPITQDKES